MHATIATLEPVQTVEVTCSDNAMMKFHISKKQRLLDDASITVDDAPDNNIMRQIEIEVHDYVALYRVFN
jgi:hypothetical protein